MAYMSEEGYKKLVEELKYLEAVAKRQRRIFSFTRSASVLRKRCRTLKRKHRSYQDLQRAPIFPTKYVSA